MTDFSGAVDGAIALLERRRRVSRRALQLELELDDETLDVLREELVDVLRVADDIGGVLVRRETDPEQIERRLLTVVMCDLVSFTPLSRALHDRRVRFPASRSGPNAKRLLNMI